MKMRNWFDKGFLLIEAILHIYLVVYLLSIEASILSIGFTIFELVMFIKLLYGHFKRDKRSKKK